MTKELVEEAIGRPPKEQEVIAEAKYIMKEIESAKRDIERQEGSKKKSQELLKEYNHKLELLKQKKYTLTETEGWSRGKTGFKVEYEKDA